MLWPTTWGLKILNYERDKCECEHGLRKVTLTRLAVLPAVCADADDC